MQHSLSLCFLGTAWPWIADMQHSLPECFLGTAWPVIAHVQHRLPCSAWALHSCLSHVSFAKAESVQHHCLSAEKVCHISHRLARPAC